MDDAPVRRIRHGRGVEQALQVPAEAGPDRAVRRFRPADADRLRLGRPDGQRRGRKGRRRHRLARGHGDPARGDPAGQGLDLDDHQRHGRDAAAPLSARRREAGLPAREDHRDRAERHPQGVRGARHVHLSAEAIDAAGDRPVRVLPGEPTQLEHDLHLGLPHQGGRLDGGRGDRPHAQRTPSRTSRPRRWQASR